MGHSRDYPDVPDWEEKPEGYKTGDMVKYEGNIFYANFWASKPGEGDPNTNGWRLYDELYDVTTSNKTEQLKIIGYIPTWRQHEEEKFDYRNSEIYQYITHGIIAFLMFSESNLGEFSNKALNDVNAIVSDVVSVGHAIGTKILIALGGATDFGFLYLMERIGNNPSDPILRQTVQKVVDFVESNDLDGVDLDLECWWAKDGNPNQDQGGRPKSDGPHPAGRGLTEFAKQLKEAMPDKIVSAALFATSWYGNNYDSELVDYLDWLGVMTYDLTGSWNDSPVGPHTALYKIREEEQESYVEEQQGEWPGGGFVDNPILSVEDSLWYWTNPFFTNWQGEGQKLPRNKLAAGVPIYGYDFAYAKGEENKDEEDKDPVSDDVPPGYQAMRYKEILSQFPDAHNAANANIKVPGDTDRPGFRKKQPGKYPYEHNIYFETPKTALEKLNFLKSVGAQGVIIWELSNEVWEDGKSIIKALYQNSGNPEKENTLALPLSEEIRGEQTSVALNDYDVAVKFYVYHDPTPPSFDGPPRKPSTIRYCFGKVKGDTVKWEESKDFHILNPDESLTRFIDYSVGLSSEDVILVRCADNKDNSLWYDFRNYSEKLQDTPDSIKRDTPTGMPVQETRDAPDSPYGYGENPCIAISNKKRVIVEVHESNKTLWYRFGRIISNSATLPPPLAIEWSPENQYDKGRSPLIAINDNGVVVEVHHSEQSNDYRLWYHIGKVNKGRIEWGKRNIYADDGIAPSVAINNNGLVIVVHHDVSGTLYYRMGRVQETKGEIEWIQDSSTRLFDGKDASVACNNKYALISYNPEKEKLGKIRDHLLRLPDSDLQWIEARGENAYCYYVLDRSITENKAIDTTKTIKVDEGAPYLNAVLIESLDSIAFPRGAVLTIKAPDGTEYLRVTDSDELLVIKSGSSLRSLMVKNPTAGDWQITLRVPEGVNFHFNFSTIPSTKIRETTENHLPDAFDTEHGRLYKREHEIDTLEEIHFLPLVNITRISQDVFHHNSLLLHESLRNITNHPYIDDDFLDKSSLSKNEFDSRKASQWIVENTSSLSFPTTTIVYTVRIVTWNLDPSNFNNPPPDPETNTPITAHPRDRLQNIMNLAQQRSVRLIALQEVPRRLLPANDQTTRNMIRNSPYNYLQLDREYAPNLRPINNTIQRGYLILYNSRHLTPVQQQIQFLSPGSFSLGVAYVRQPVYVDFAIRNSQGRRFRFVTWHSEAIPAMTPDLTYRAIQEIEQSQYSQSWVLAGDLNHSDTAFENLYAARRGYRPRGNSSLTHDGNSLDHIMTSSIAQQTPIDNLLTSAGLWYVVYSGKHYALFADIIL